MSEDLTSLGIIALCAVIGFIIVWTYLSARSEDKKRDEHDDRPGPDDPRDP